MIKYQVHTEKSCTIGIIAPNDFIKRLPFGGASGFVQNIMHKLDHPAIVFGAGVNGTPLWKTHGLGDHVKFIGVYPLSIPSRLPLRIQAILGYLLNRRRILNSGVDLLYIHSPECTLPFLFGNQRIPVVFHQHGSGNPVVNSTFSWARNGLLAWLFEQMYRVIYQRADWIIAIDRLCSAQVSANSSEGKMSLLLNAVDLQLFYPDEVKRKEFRRNFSLSDDAQVLLFVGRLEQIKRVDRIVESMLYLSSSKKRFHLFIAGDGTQRRSLEELAKVNELSNVTFLGYTQHFELPALYNMADLLLLPSEMEGTPMVILEAMACGTPTVASKVGGVPDLICDGVNGMALDDSSPESLAKTIEQITMFPLDRHIVSASAARFGTDLFVVEFNNIISKLVEQNHREV